MPSQVYETLLEQLASGELTKLQREVFNLLKASPAGRTRAEMVVAIYGYRPTNLAADPNDRKIRKAIEALRGRLIPIVSSSGESGYRLDTSRETVRKMISEWASRREKLQNLINAAAKFYEMPEFYVEPAQVTQLELIGV